MATILFAWELGGGWGHAMRALPILRCLHERGHRVCLALRDLSRAESIFGGLPYLQAPVRTSPPADPIATPRAFAHLLHNSGFADLSELRPTADAWRRLYEHVQPGLILFDHSPTALLAARCECQAGDDRHGLLLPAGPASLAGPPPLAGRLHTASRR